MERVRAAMEQLSPDYREVLVLREMEGLSYKEIAAVVQVPLGTVMSRLARARERLLALLEAVATHGVAPVSCEHLERNLDAYVDRELGSRGGEPRSAITSTGACRAGAASPNVRR